MLIQNIKKFLSSVRLTTQIFILQALTIILILIIVSVISFFQIDRFQYYIKVELLESIIQKSIISNIQLLVGESMQLTFILYQQYTDEMLLFQKLYNFQSLYQIQINGLLEDCDNTTLLNSYQQCFHGHQIDNSEINQIKQFIQFQNYIMPYRQDRQSFLRYFNLYLGDQLSYSIQVQDQKPIIDENLENIYLQFMTFKRTLAIQQVQNGNVYVFMTIPNMKIAYGMLVQALVQPFQNLTYSSFQIRSFIVVEQGLILTDSKMEFQGQNKIQRFHIYFQNISGFTNYQFELIKNYSLGQQVQNECKQKVQGNTLCLIDGQNKQKFIISYYYQSDYVQYIINMYDDDFVGEIRTDFNKQFDYFVNKQIMWISVGLVAILMLCFFIQALLIIKLSRPLQMLVKIAQYNINHNQYKFQTIIRTKNRSQIEKLQDSYFDLINLSKQNTQHRARQNFSHDPSLEKLGLINKMEQKREAIALKKIIKQYIK